MICNKCNSEIPENSKFCQVCGTSITPVKNIVPIANDNGSDSSNSIETQTINTNLNNQHQPIQNNNKNDNDSLKIISILLGIIGFVVTFFHFVTAFAIFILGIIIGSIYKNKTKNKCFGLTLNIIGLILNIIFFFTSVWIVNNTLNELKESAECAEQGGYLKNGKCELEKDDLQNNINKISECRTNGGYWENGQCKSNNTGKNDTYVGFWACKDNGVDASMSFESFTQINDSEYKIGITFINEEKYMITYSSSKWEKGSYKMIQTGQEDLYAYYNLKINIEEKYNFDNNENTNTFINTFDIEFDNTYQKMIIMSKDGKNNYLCYKD